MICTFNTIVSEKIGFFDQKPLLPWLNNPNISYFDELQPNLPNSLPQRSLDILFLRHPDLQIDVLKLVDPQVLFKLSFVEGVMYIRDVLGHFVPEVYSVKLLIEGEGRFQLNLIPPQIAKAILGLLNYLEESLTYLEVHPELEVVNLHMLKFVCYLALDIREHLYKIALDSLEHTRHFASDLDLDLVYKIFVPSYVVATFFADESYWNEYDEALNILLSFIPKHRFAFQMVNSLRSKYSPTIETSSDHSSDSSSESNSHFVTTPNHQNLELSPESHGTLDFDNPSELLTIEETNFSNDNYFLESKSEIGLDIIIDVNTNVNLNSNVDQNWNEFLFDEQESLFNEL